jgi:diguanylate cyclase (GGDEF)-like protein/PAS domain S-box-containing protein
MVLPEGIMMAASCPILHSDRSGPSNGFLIMARYLDNTVVQTMMDLTNFNIQIELFNNPDLPQDFVSAKTAFSNGMSFFIATPSNQQINGYSLLKDGFNNPAIIVKVDRPRDIYKQGALSFSIFIMIVLVMGVLFSLIFFHFFDLRILRRVKMLSTEFKQIALSKDLGSRVTVKGSDEMSSLAGEINKTLIALENKDIALKQHEERIRFLVDGAEDIIYLQDLDGKYIYFNGPTQYRLSLDDVIGKMPGDLFDPDKAEEIMADFQKVIRTREPVSSELSSNLFGNNLWFSNLIYPVKNPSGEILAIGTISRNVSAYKNLEEQLRISSLHDPLTGLPNRAYYMEKVSSIPYQRIGPYSYYCALLALDLDHFKKVNDTYGHPAGDQLLIEVGHRLQGCVRPDDTVARQGGDEFSIILQKVTSIEDVIQVADRIQTVFSQPVRIQDQDVFITTSIGIALVSSNYNNLEDLLRDADIALYQAKSEGKNRYHIFDKDITIK